MPINKEKALFDAETATQEDVDTELARINAEPRRTGDDDTDRQNANRRRQAQGRVGQARNRLAGEALTGNPLQEVDTQNRTGSGGGISSEGDFGPGAIRLNTITPVNSKVGGR